jgi:ATP-dependent protease HslVU (ClpYQ) peptidase subunit
MATHGNNSLNDCRITSNAFQIRTLAALSILESFLGIVSGYRRLLLQCKMHVRLDQDEDQEASYVASCLMVLQSYSAVLPVYL